MILATEFSEQYKAFSANVAFAARVLNYHLEIDKLAVDPTSLNALNTNARFWVDFKYCSLQTVIIFLGKIFDKDQKTYSVSKLINSAFSNTTHFKKSALRERKIEAANGEFEGLEEYIEQAHELSKDDIKLIKAEVKKARILWSKFEPLRMKIFAHQEMITEEEKSELYRNALYEELQQLIQLLLNISHAFEQAEINGRKPELKNNYEGPINVAKREIKTLFHYLILGLK